MTIKCTSSGSHILIPFDNRTGTRPVHRLQIGWHPVLHCIQLHYTNRTNACLVLKIQKMKIQKFKKFIKIKIFTFLSFLAANKLYNGRKVSPTVQSHLRLCLVGLIWGDLLFKKMDLRGWRLFGWPDLRGWMRRDLQDWRDEDRNYKITLVNEVKITKYPWLWKLQNTLLSRFRVCNNKYYIWKINWFIPNFSNNWFQ